VSDAAPPAALQALLRRNLLAGVRSADMAELGAALGVPPESGELSLAHALVRALADANARGVALGAEGGSNLPREDHSRVVDGRASFLVRLTAGGDQASVDLGRIEDLRTLLAVMRAGSLRQRRAATLRVGELLAGGGRLASDELRGVALALLQARSLPIAYEAQVVCSRLTGAEGRRARAESQQWQQLCEQCEQQVRAFWDGDLAEEPIAALPDDQRVQLLVRTRDLSELLVRHLSAVISGADGTSDRRARVALLGALLHAGDPRLLPALRAIVEEEENDLLVPAVRALGRIDDPRAHAALRASYERTAAAEQRLLLAGALGIAGDSRGLGYVREALAAGDERLLRFALDALAELGGSDDVQVVTESLARRDPALVAAAVRTLGRIGDGRALSALAEFALRAERPALRAEIEDALDAIRARMELLGEEPPAQALAAHMVDTAKHAALVKRKDPAAVRLRAQFCHVLGKFWLSLGAFSRALARLETAAALQPDWVAPVLLEAMAYARRSQSAQALASFRRALGIDRGAVENNAAAARMLAQAFLRRAEAMERDGRDDIARGLLEEALAIDLRRAPSDLRFAIEQRLHALKIKAA